MSFDFRVYDGNDYLSHIAGWFRARQLGGKYPRFEGFFTANRRLELVNPALSQVLEAFVSREALVVLCRFLLGLCGGDVAASGLFERLSRNVKSWRELRDEALEAFLVNSHPSGLNLEVRASGLLKRARGIALNTSKLLKTVGRELEGRDDYPSRILALLCREARRELLLGGRDGRRPLDLSGVCFRVAGELGIARREVVLPKKGKERVIVHFGGPKKGGKSDNQSDYDEKRGWEHSAVLLLEREGVRPANRGFVSPGQAVFLQRVEALFRIIRSAVSQSEVERALWVFEVVARRISEYLEKFGKSQGDWPVAPIVGFLQELYPFGFDVKASPWDDADTSERLCALAVKIQNRVRKGIPDEYADVGRYGEKWFAELVQDFIDAVASHRGSAREFDADELLLSRTLDGLLSASKKLSGRAEKRHLPALVFLKVLLRVMFHKSFDRLFARHGFSVDDEGYKGLLRAFAAYGAKERGLDGLRSFLKDAVSEESFVAFRAGFEGLMDELGIRPKTLYQLYQAVFTELFKSAVEISGNTNRFRSILLDAFGARGKGLFPAAETAAGYRYELEVYPFESGFGEVVRVDNCTAVGHFLPHLLLFVFPVTERAEGQEKTEKILWLLENFVFGNPDFGQSCEEGLAEVFEKLHFGGNIFEPNGIIPQRTLREIGSSAFYGGRAGCEVLGDIMVVFDVLNALGNFFEILVCYRGISSDSRLTGEKALLNHLFKVALVTGHKQGFNENKLLRGRSGWSVSGSIPKKGGAAKHMAYRRNFHQSFLTPRTVEFRCSGGGVESVVEGRKGVLAALFLIERSRSIYPFGLKKELAGRFPGRNCWMDSHELVRVFLVEIEGCRKGRRRAVRVRAGVPGVFCVLPPSCMPGADEIAVFSHARREGIVESILRECERKAEDGWDVFVHALLDVRSLPRDMSGAVSASPAARVVERALKGFADPLDMRRGVVIMDFPFVCLKRRKSARGETYSCLRDERSGIANAVLRVFEGTLGGEKVGSYVSVSLVPVRIVSEDDIAPPYNSHAVYYVFERISDRETSSLYGLVAFAVHALSSDSVNYPFSSLKPMLSSHRGAFEVELGEGDLSPSLYVFDDVLTADLVAASLHRWGRYLGWDAWCAG